MAVYGAVRYQDGTHYHPSPTCRRKRQNFTARSQFRTAQAVLTMAWHLEPKPPRMDFSFTARWHKAIVRIVGYDEFSGHYILDGDAGHCPTDVEILEDVQEIPAISPESTAAASRETGGPSWGLGGAFSNTAKCDAATCSGARSPSFLRYLHECGPKRPKAKPAAFCFCCIMISLLANLMAEAHNARS